MSKIQKELTNQIIAQLEAGAGQWEMPWHNISAGMPTSLSTGKPYRGINLMVLMAQRRSSQYWATFNQWKARGCQIRKGEKATKVFIFKTSKYEDKETGEERVGAYWNAYAVFNAEQVDGWEEPEKPIQLTGAEQVQAIDAFIANTGARIHHGHDSCFYDRAADKIGMVNREIFKGSKKSSPTEAYYGTLIHELIHWTGHKSRLDRVFGIKFGDDNYAREELVAELGSAFLSVGLGLTPELRPDHASYIQSWIRQLKQDPKAIFTAASKAQKAVDHLHELQISKTQQAA